MTVGIDHALIDSMENNETMFDWMPLTITYNEPKEVVIERVEEINTGAL